MFASLPITLVFIGASERVTLSSKGGNEEFAYVVEGELIFTVEGEEYRLGSGDSIYLLSTVPHAIHNDTDEPAKVLWVLTPRFNLRWGEAGDRCWGNPGGSRPWVAATRTFGGRTRTALRANAGLVY